MDVSVSAPGAYNLWFWLEDAAGNTDPAYESEPLLLRFDDEAPGRAELSSHVGWLSEADAIGLQQVIGLEAGAHRPISGISGYRVTTDGTDPDISSDEVAEGDPATYTLDDLPEGITEIRAQAVSNAGVPSEEIGSALLKVDRSAPSVSAAGLPDPAEWSRVPVSVQLTGSDQAGLSGMSPAPVVDPVEGGGHLAYGLDGAPTEKVRGGQHAITVTSDGSHVLTYRAVDAAGNASVERAAEFKIDRTGPLGSFDRQDPTDPRKISVSVFDAASGIGGGRIEYRREGVAQYESLPTAMAGNKLVTRLEDVDLPKGRYEFRAKVRDVAGNVSMVDRWQGGGAAALTLPVRVPTRVEVAGRAAAKKAVCSKRARRKKGRKGSPKVRAKRKRCVRKLRAPSPGSSIPLAYGKRAISAGRVLTIHGMPVPGADVIVEGQLRSGGSFTRLGTARTNHLGAFSFTVPRGASRAVRYRYEGSNTIAPSSGRITTRVPAAIRLKPSKRRLLNGQAVVFRGQLLGKPVPSGGKVVALQAKVGRRWRTFATPRANARGRFKHRYRFTATTGLRRYVFRAVATREAAYSYERGVSPKVSVVVRGR